MSKKKGREEGKRKKGKKDGKRKENQFPSVLKNQSGSLKSAYYVILNEIIRREL